MIYKCFNCSKTWQCTQRCLFTSMSNAVAPLLSQHKLGKSDFLKFQQAYLQPYGDHIIATNFFPQLLISTYKQN